MAKTQKKMATKTGKRTQAQRKTSSRQNTRAAREQQQSNTFFVISMSVLVGALLFADLFMIMI